MRLRFNIRTQLFLMFILLVAAILGSIINTQFTYNNIDIVLQAQDHYLTLDSHVSDQLNFLAGYSRDLKEYQSFDYIAALLVDESSISKATEIRITAANFKTAYSNVITFASQRQSEGYFIDRSKFESFPFIIEPDKETLNQIDGIIDTSSFGVYDLMNSLNTTVTSISDIYSNKLAQIENNQQNITYINLARDYHLILDNVISLKDIATYNLANLTRTIVDDGNVADIQAVYPVANNFTLQLDNITENTANLVNAWFEPSGNSLSLDEVISISDYQSEMQVTINSISELLSDLVTFNNTIFTATEQSDFITLYQATNGSQFGNNLLNSTAYLRTNLNELYNARLDIQDFGNDPIFIGIDSLINTLNVVIHNFNNEHSTFIKLNSQLLERILNDLRVLNTTLVVLLSAIAIFILPITVTINQALIHLQRNFRKVEKGDLRGRPPKISIMKNEFKSVEGSFYHLLGYLRDTLTVVKNSSEYVAGISEELAAGTTEASDSINKVSNTIGSISSGARTQNRMIGEIEGKLNDLEKSINQASIQINAASNLLSKLAQRTNILGLNASINAAKSGKFGEGFGLVADEIRQLSLTSRESANSISDLVNQINYSMKAIVKGITEDVTEIRQVAESTASGSEESNFATSEQVIMIQEISETSHQLADLANNLNQLLEQFRID